MTFPNRNNDNFPDLEQEKRAQARQASAFAAGETNELPAFATKGPDAQIRDGEYTPADSNVRPDEEPNAVVAEEPSVASETTPEPDPETMPEPDPETTPEPESADPNA